MTDHCRIKADAVMFDKDGTLIDFDAFWVSLSDAAVTDMLTQLGLDRSLTGEILEAFGVHNGVTDVNSVLCKGTYAQMAQIAHDVLAGHGVSAPGDEIESVMLAAYNRNFSSGTVKPTSPNLRATLSALKKQNKKLAVATTDNREITLFCLEQLGIADLFDLVYTDDGTLPAKPNPDCAWDFCSRTGVNAESVVMVGDTMTDLAFARNAGLKMVGLAQTDKTRPLFAGKADAIIRDLSELLKILE